MTRLAIIFSLLFVTPAWAGEKIMRCLDSAYKYEKSLSGEDSCYKRMKGRWFEISRWGYVAKDGVCTSKITFGEYKGELIALLDFTVGEYHYLKTDETMGFTACNFLKN